MDKREIQLLILITTIVVLTLAITLVLFFLYFQNKKTKLLLDKEVSEKRFKAEINSTQIEIREQALEKISWEIHDNVGQLLSVAKMQLNMLHVTLKDKEIKEKIGDIIEVVGKSLQELRDLAKTLNPNIIKNLGFLEALETEVKRLNRLNFIPTKITILGEPYKLKQNQEIILFRILQEFLNNSLKHSKASKIDIKLDYSSSNLEIYAKDNGVGFDISMIKNQKGLGLTNITSRASLINAKAIFNSEKGNGTSLAITCKCK